jgi:tripeptidyl-peptidase-1
MPTMYHGLLCVAFALAASAAPHGWTSSSRPRNSDEPLAVRVALVQPRVAELERTLIKVSDPRSADYGKYLTPDQVAELVSLPAETRALVMHHLGCASEQVACEFSIHRDYVLIRTTVARAEVMFNVTLTPFERTLNGTFGSQTIYRSATPPVLAAPMAPFVDFVHGISDFPPPPLHRMRSTVAGTPGDKVDPSVLKKQYGITATGSASSSVSCAEFEHEQFKQADVDDFADTFSLPRQTINVVGPNNGGYEGEGTLDVEYLIGTAPGLNVTFWSIPWKTFDADLLTWAQAVQSVAHPPLVHSISWGSGETGSADYDLPVLVRTNTEFQKMGVQGLSVLAASGDDGTGNTGTFGCKKFDPNWPAGSPFLTAVGGTYLQSGSEVGWADSGGGFSNLWPRPAWQEEAVATCA